MNRTLHFTARREYSQFRLAVGQWRFIGHCRSVTVRLARGAACAARDSPIAPTTVQLYPFGTHLSVVEYAEQRYNIQAKDLASLVRSRASRVACTDMVVTDIPTEIVDG